MNSPAQFDILIKRKIPFLTNLIFGGLIFCVSILFIIYLMMLPAKYATGEMTIAYYIIVIPNIFKTFLSYATIVLLVLLPLYWLARKKQSAVLTCYGNRFEIVGNKINFVILFRKINKVYCNDLHNLRNKPKGVLQFVFKQKQRKATTFVLKNYQQGEEFLRHLSLNENFAMFFYEYSMLEDQLEE